MEGADAKTAGAFTPIALVFLAGLVGGVVANVFYPVSIWPGPWIRFFGVFPFVAGIWLFASSRNAFRRHRTSLMPWSPSTELVQDGPYRFSRNPIYLAFVLLYLGLGLFFDSSYVLIMLAIVLVLFDRFQIPREERYLKERFGDEFNRYRAKVRRWV